MKKIKVYRVFFKIILIKIILISELILIIIKLMML
jgi:hypothetical protein